MSVDKERYEARRWLDTAREDLEAARSPMGSDKFSHSCFFSQQAGEKAIKALWYFLGGDPWGCSIQKLIAELPEPVAFERLQPFLQDGSLLDRYYIPTRYPNGLPDLTPGQVYFRQDAEICLESSRRLLLAVAEFMVPREASCRTPNDCYSTVTLFARFLGWSTSHPRSTAI